MTVRQYLQIKSELFRTFTAMGVVPTDVLLFQSVRAIVRKGIK